MRVKVCDRVELGREPQLLHQPVLHPLTHVSAQWEELGQLLGAVLQNGHHCSAPDRELAVSGRGAGGRGRDGGGGDGGGEAVEFRGGYSGE